MSPIENVTELFGVNDLYYQVWKYVTVPQQWQKGVWGDLGKLVFYNKLPNLLKSQLMEGEFVIKGNHNGDTCQLLCH